MKNKSINILIVSFLLLGIMAATLIAFVDASHDTFQDSVTVNASGITEQTMTVRELALNPTESREYEVKLKCDVTGLFRISLDHDEKKNGGMKAFVLVTVRCNGVETYSGTLAQLLDTGTIIDFESELHAKEPLLLIIYYEMPYDVGNEAQGTYSDFDIHLKIEKI